uniref:Uncharacterized protein n=1 Tax=Metapenaeus ensis majanivirus TaxID=2984279 RepID=A0A9C7EYP9_9VIRU|nr:MAG: hypothetical protein [Metapenaeus ensis majanivirus]
MEKKNYATDVSITEKMKMKSILDLMILTVPPDIVKKVTFENKDQITMSNIAEFITKIWSPRMRQHAENVILNWALKLEYFSNWHHQWICILKDVTTSGFGGGCCSGSGGSGGGGGGSGGGGGGSGGGGGGSGDDDDGDWVIENQNDAIIELVWIRFNMRQHFAQTKDHRFWVLKSYERLKSFVPKLSQEVIERHDLSKFAFNQAVGYTLRWVHNIRDSPIWKSACDFHLYHEPHHPQVWKRWYNKTVQEKRMKIKNWQSNMEEKPVKDISEIRFESDDMAQTFLQESLIDMIGIEWERKKGKQEDISLSDLVYMDYRFLERYTQRQKKMVYDLINSVISTDSCWLDNVDLSEREKRLLSTISTDEQPFIIYMIEKQKKGEISRLYNAKADGRGSYHDYDDNQLIQLGLDKAYYIAVCRMVTEFWNVDYKKYAENIILKHAVQEGYIDENDVKWISVFDKADEKDSLIKTIKDDNLIIKVLWEDYQLDNFFARVKNYRSRVKQFYDTYKLNIPQEFINRYDLSKLSFFQSMGLALYEIHDINYPEYNKANKRHLYFEPHHPEMWSNKIDKAEKKRRLEHWLFYKNDKKNTYGLDIEAIDFTLGNMPTVFLKQSFLDYAAHNQNILNLNFYNTAFSDQDVEHFKHLVQKHVIENKKEC